MRVTEPVGVAAPLPLLTVTVTMVDCAVVMLEGDGDTVTVGVMADGAVTVKVTGRLTIEPTVAVIWVVPGATAIAMPVLGSMVATEVVCDAHTAPVAFCTLPSLNTL